MNHLEIFLEKGVFVSHTQKDRNLPAFGSVLTASLILTILGLVGLILLVVLTVPTLGPRWLLFFLITLACAGIALPVAYYLHKRFPSNPVPSASVLVREAIWFGIYIDLILWLQFGRVLNAALAIFIAIGLAAVELLIRLRETSRFSPQSINNE